MEPEHTVSFDELMQIPMEPKKTVTYYPEAVVDGLEDVIRKLQNEIWVLRAMREPPEND